MSCPKDTLPNDDSHSGLGSDNPTDWIVPAQDSKGHSVREVVRVTPAMERAMEVLIQSSATPYKTKGDLIRHALEIHLKWLARVGGQLPQHFLAGMSVQRELVADDMYRTEVEKSFEALEVRIRHHLNRGDRSEAVRLVALVLMEFARVAETPWKQRYVETFLRQYGHFIGIRMIEPVEERPPLQIEGGVDEYA